MFQDVKPIITILSIILLLLFVYGFLTRNKQKYVRRIIYSPEKDEEKKSVDVYISKSIKTEYTELDDIFDNNLNKLFSTITHRTIK